MARFGLLHWLLPAFLAIAGASGSFASPNAPRATWPNGPFVTSGRWIQDASGATVTYVGVNWPGSLDAMIPEGLQYQSIESIVSKIKKDLDMNTIRLTYATEMIDQYYDNGQKDVTIQKALTDALGEDDGGSVYDKIISNNPSFDTSTTRLEVYDAIAAECAKQEIYVHLDNHVSKAGWCCSPLDGNAWWGDEFFIVDNWTRGLSFMAQHGKSWSNLMSMSLRNELRISLTNSSVANTYNWEEWYSYIQQGADAINKSNSDVLIFISGLNSDQDLSPVVNGTAFTPGTATFNRDDFSGYGDKLVLELHAYDNLFGPGPSNCTAVEEELFNAGFKSLTDDATNQFPMVLTEFGLVQNGTASQNAYISCLLDYVPSRNAGWMIWQLGGSYYIREGTQDFDETWGLLNHDWTDWRSSDFINNSLTPAVKKTFTINNDTDPNSGSAGTSDKESRGASLRSNLGQDLFDLSLPFYAAVLTLLSLMFY